MSFFSDYQQAQIRKFALANEFLRVYGSSGQHRMLQEAFNSSIDNALDPSPESIKSAAELFGELSIYSMKAQRFAKMSFVGFAILMAGSVSVWITHGAGLGILCLLVSVILWFCLDLIFQLRYLPRIKKRFKLTNTEVAFALNHIVGDPKWQIDMYRQMKT